MSLMPESELAITSARRHGLLPPSPSKAQLDRIEAKLDRLLMALADESEQDEQQGHDLEGNALPRERDPNEPL